MIIMYPQEFIGILISFVLLMLLFLKIFTVIPKTKGKTHNQKIQILEEELGFKRIILPRLFYSILFSLALIVGLYLIFGYQKTNNVQIEVITIIMVLYSLFLAPIWEELAFRRILFDDIILNHMYKSFNIDWKDWKNIKSVFWFSFALSLQALLFVLAHGSTTIGFSYYGRFLMAAIAGLVYIKYDRNIYYPIALHFAYNLSNVLVNFIL